MIIHFVLSRKICRLLRRNYLLLGQVHLITCNDYRSVRILHLVNRLNPIANRLERFVCSLVEGYDYAICLSIELISNVPELLLAGCVPYLHLHAFLVLLIEVLSFDEVDGDGLYMTRLERSSANIPQQTSLTDSCIT